MSELQQKRTTGKHHCVRCDAGMSLNVYCQKDTFYCRIMQMKINCQAVDDDCDLFVAKKKRWEK